MNTLLVIAALGVMSAWPANATAQQRSNAQAGHDFALYNCDGCHLVGRDQELRPLITGYGPSFADVAHRPGTTAPSLRDFLSRPHGYSNMPYPDLTAADRENIIAYIMSLSGPH